MINIDSTPTLLSQAMMLAQQIVEVSEEQAPTKQLPEDAFMAYRPNSLAESYQHGLSVARVLADWQASPELQAAGLLHSFVCKGVLSPQQVAKTCNQRAAFLCQTYWQILQETPENQRHLKPAIAKRIKLYKAAYCDPDLAFLGIASLWDHFVLTRQSDAWLQRHFADEATEVMLPLLSMLGMESLKTDVEEWVMQYGHTQPDYLHLVKRLIQTDDIRTEAFEWVKTQLHPKLPGAELRYRFPRPFQVYNPHLPEKAHPEAFQKLSVDLLVMSEEECYTALRWIHRLWQPVENSLIDHIGLSELNGKRYLLTTVVVPMGNNLIRAEFNIRTHKIEQINRWGLAAILMQDRLAVDLPQTWWSRREEDYAKICSAAMGSLPETLYVFSPQGQIFPFHRGCTVVDYAYHLHSELANQCKRFKVNGEVVPPTTILRHLDLVELERDPQFSGPNRAWLTAAHTNRARTHIDRFLKRQSQGHLRGRATLDRRLKELANHYRIDIPEYRLEQALNQATRHFNLERVENLLAEIAAGRLTPDLILHPLFAEEVVRQIDLPQGLRLLPHQLHLAQCCKPHPGDEITGRVRYHQGKPVHLKIHRANCSHITFQENDLTLQWRLQPQLNTVARLEITALAADNLLFDTLRQFQANQPHLTLHKMEAITRSGITRLNFTVEAKDQHLISKITQQLQQLPGYNINEIRQMQLLFSEREELVKPTARANFNPYRRQPVQNRDMFFGRTEELAVVYEMLHTGIGVIFVQGQKRVGKTSLLLHLKKHYLKRRSMMPVFVDFQLLGNLNGPNAHYEIASTIYNDLQADNPPDKLEPPLQELFELEPTTQLADYLTRVQSQFGFRKLVLLIDEFSRTIDAYQQHRLDDTFFQQWRGIVQNTAPQVNYVMVVQQQTYNHLLEHNNPQAITPVWHLLEFGETLLLKPLSEKDARQLIERPTYNYLEYSPDALRYVWQLTGGRPFLIHAFCYNLVRHMTHNNRRLVEWSDVDMVQREFMYPHESLFAHLLDVIRDIAYAIPICQYLAKSLQPASLAQLQAALPHISPEHLPKSLQKLIDQHILAQPQPETWFFNSLLFGRWLAVNTV